MAELAGQKAFYRSSIVCRRLTVTIRLVRPRLSMFQTVILLLLQQCVTLGCGRATNKPLYLLNYPNGLNVFFGIRSIVHAFHQIRGCLQKDKTERSAVQYYPVPFSTVLGKIHVVESNTHRYIAMEEVMQHRRRDLHESQTIFTKTSPLRIIDSSCN